MTVSTAYLAAGANRQTAAADWGDDGTLCYGAGVNLAVWRPTDENGVVSLLSGHQDTVKAVQYLGRDEADIGYFVSGGDDCALKLWAIARDGTGHCIQTVDGAHAAPVNYIAAERSAARPRRSSSKSPESPESFERAKTTIFATGGADAAIKIWAWQRRQSGHAMAIVLLQTIKTAPRYFPLCLALVSLSSGDQHAPRSWLLAAAGTNNRIQVFVGTETEPGSQTETEPVGATFSLQATLAGHEGWVRSLDFGWEGGARGRGDLLLASASQDKYVRLWRVHRGSAMPAPSASAAAAASLVGADQLGDFFPSQGSPSNKAHRMRVVDDDYSVTFEALLFGHEDWIYSAKWHHGAGDEDKNQPTTRLRLLTVSADNSLAIWEADAASGIWVTTARLGELSKEKGATTATGSVGGFWAGLWAAAGDAVVVLCRTGSWRRWQWHAPQARWVQAMGISGHVEPVTGIAWSRDGAYLLSTGGDQTTRLHAQWTTRALSPSSSPPSWHEMARPQIHGYDLNCIDSLGASQFVSGADEKLMRVFHEPKTVARLLASLTSTDSSTAAAADIDALPDAANMPVLGLSNKAVDVEAEGDQHVSPSPSPSPSQSPSIPSAPDILARNTLWPETEKLYGHGYEISCLAVSHDGTLVASACRASSLNHAVVRLFETKRWTEVRPPLAAHTLTVARLRFSADDRLLLSVGRDRQWAVFERRAGAGDAGDGDDNNNDAVLGFALKEANTKAHTRMILDCAWAPGQRRVFATAGRDKNVKVWAADSDAGAFALATTLPQDHAVTAVDFLWRTSTNRGRPGSIVLAVGTEGGQLSVVTLEAGSLAVSSVLALDATLRLPKAVVQLAWRPPQAGSKAADDCMDLAIAGADSSLRVYQVDV